MSAQTPDKPNEPISNIGITVNEINAVDAIDSIGELATIDKELPNLFDLSAVKHAYFEYIYVDYTKSEKQNYEMNWVVIISRNVPYISAKILTVTEESSPVEARELLIHIFVICKFMQNFSKYIRTHGDLFDELEIYDEDEVQRADNICKYYGFCDFAVLLGNTLQLILLYLNKLLPREGICAVDRTVLAVCKQIDLDADSSINPVPGLFSL
jgi:hypothetical protein